MGELSTLLIVFGYGAGAGTFCALVLALLVGMFLNTRRSRGEDEDDGALVIPYSALAGGMPGSAGNPMSMQDAMRMRAAMAAQAGAGAPPAPPENKDDKPKLDGQYL